MFTENRRWICDEHTWSSVNEVYRNLDKHAMTFKSRIDKIHKHEVKQSMVKKYSSSFCRGEKIEKIFHNCWKTLKKMSLWEHMVSEFSKNKCLSLFFYVKLENKFNLLLNTHTVLSNTMKMQSILIIYTQNS